MTSDRPGQIAVIFTSRRTQGGDADYGVAASVMEALAARQPGYRGFVTARGADGLGVTVSYWADDAAAKAWRDHPLHAETRRRGRDDWYSDYTVDVARIERAYDWKRDE